MPVLTEEWHDREDPAAAQPQRPADRRRQLQIRARAGTEVDAQVAGIGFEHTRHGDAVAVLVSRSSGRGDGTHETTGVGRESDRGPWAGGRLVHAAEDD